MGFLIDKIKLFGYVYKLNLNKQHRDYSLIDKEYNSGLWNRDINEIDFETHFGNYNRNDAEDFNLFYFKNKLEKFHDENIIELGCGLGRNIFLLYKNDFHNLEGCDISSNAIKKLNQYAKHKNLPINFFTHDLKDPFLSKSLENKILFTFTVLEQCKHNMKNVLKNIIASKPKKVINFEVDYTSSPYLVRKYFDARDYQNNLVYELKNLESENLITNLSIIEMQYGGSPVNKLSVIQWEPSSNPITC